MQPTRESTWPRRAAARFCSRNGVAAIEFAMVSPMLIILLTGVVELGMAGFQAMQVQSAVEAGALYAAQNGAGNLSAIALAVVNATGTAGITATPAPTAFCGCPKTAGVASQGSDCTTVCSDGTPPGQYVQVNAALPHKTLMPFLNLPLPATLTARTTIRVQ